MAITSVNLPAHLYPHTEVFINDNTIRTYARAEADNVKILAVFSSPKGIDRKMTTITGGLKEFDQRFGVGPFSTYGQPLLNARAAANTGVVTLQCMRVTAENATYSNNVVWAQYRLVIKRVEIEDENKNKSVVPKKFLQVRYVAAPGKYVTEISDFQEEFQTYSEMSVDALDNMRDKDIAYSKALTSDGKFVLPIPKYVDDNDETPTVADTNRTIANVIEEEYDSYIADPENYEGDTAKARYFNMLESALEEIERSKINPDDYAEKTVYDEVTMYRLAIPEIITHDGNKSWQQENAPLSNVNGVCYTTPDYYDFNDTTDVENVVTFKLKDSIAKTLTEDEYEAGLATHPEWAVAYESYVEDEPRTVSAQEQIDALVEARVKATKDLYNWNQIPFMSFISKGRGIFADSLGVRISNHPRADKTTIYKNYYFRLFDGTSTIEGPARVTLSENAIVGTKSYYIEEVVNGITDEDGSINVKVFVNPHALSTLYNIYMSNCVDDPESSLVTMDNFDPILGIDKLKASTRSQNWQAYSDISPSTSRLSNFEIVDYDEDESEADIQFNRVLGIPLRNGSDGDFALGSPNREKALRIAYYNAFMGKTDRYILSKTRFPLDAVFDAAFPFGQAFDEDTPESVVPIEYRSLKLALAWLADKRYEDCFCYLDLGTNNTDRRYLTLDQMEKINSGISDENIPEFEGFETRQDAWDYAEDLNDYVKWWTFSIDGYYGKIKDPYSKKVVSVSSTYNLIQKLPLHWDYYGGKHIPYAGSKYGVIDSYIKGSVFPVFDVDLDEEDLDNLIDAHVNYAQIDAKGNVIRGTQTTRYPKIGDSLTISNLSEINNAHIILDIKKDAIKLVTNYAYNFNEAEDVATFNRDAGELVTKYSGAQVRSISASFSRTEEEAELGILHLYISVVHKSLVKINLIDIDVNRAVTES